MSLFKPFIFTQIVGLTDIFLLAGEFQAPSNHFNFNKIVFEPAPPISDNLI